MPAKTYQIGPYIATARTKTDARAKAEAEVGYRARQLEMYSPWSGFFKGLGDIEEIFVVFTYHGWSYGYKDEYGRREISNQYNSRDDAAAACIGHVADLYMGHPDLSDHCLTTGTQWVVQACGHYRMSSDISTHICADIDYKRRARAEMLKADAAIG